MINWIGRWKDSNEIARRRAAERTKRRLIHEDSVSQSANWTLILCVYFVSISNLENTHSNGAIHSEIDISVPVAPISASVLAFSMRARSRLHHLRHGWRPILSNFSGKMQSFLVSHPSSPSQNSKRIMEAIERIFSLSSMDFVSSA